MSSAQRHTPVIPATAWEVDAKRLQFEISLDKLARPFLKLKAKCTKDWGYGSVQGPGMSLQCWDGRKKYRWFLIHNWGLEGGKSEHSYLIIIWVEIRTKSLCSTGLPDQVWEEKQWPEAGGGGMKRWHLLDVKGGGCSVLSPCNSPSWAMWEKNWPWCHLGSDSFARLEKSLDSLSE